MPSQPIEACACNRRRSAVWKSKEKWTCTRLRSTNRVTIRWWIETIENLNDYSSTILQLKISSNPVTLMATEGNQLTSPEVARARAFRRNVETITPNFSPFAWGPVWLSCGAVVDDDQVEHHASTDNYQNRPSDGEIEPLFGDCRRVEPDRS